MEWLRDALAEWRAEGAMSTRRYGPELSIQFARHMDEWFDECGAHCLARVLDEDLALAYPLMLARSPDDIDTAVIHNGGLVRGCFLVTRAQASVKSMWAWPAQVLKDTPSPLFERLFGAAMALLSTGAQHPPPTTQIVAMREVARLKVTWTPDGRLLINDMVPLEAFNMPVANVLAKLLQQVGAATERSVWLTGDSPLFGWVSDPKRVFELGDDDDPVAWCAAERARATSTAPTLLLRPWDGLPPSYEDGNISLPLSPPRAYPPATFSPEETRRVQPLWDLMNVAGPNPTWVTPLFVWGRVTLDLRWTQELDTHEALRLAEQAMLSAPAKHVLYVAGIEHADARTQPLIVATDMALLKRALQALSKAYDMPIVVPSRFVPGVHATDKSVLVAHRYTHV
jgi:hypothetical protein